MADGVSATRSVWVRTRRSIRARTVSSLASRMWRLRRGCGRRPPAPAPPCRHRRRRSVLRADDLHHVAHVHEQKERIRLVKIV